MEQQQKDKLAEATEGLQYEATVLKQPMDLQPKKYNDLQIKWSVTLNRNGSILQIPYFQGIGHFPWGRDKKGMKPGFVSVYHDETARKSLERGKVFSESMKYVGATWPKPAIEEILHCLVMELDVLDYPDRREWAENLDFGSDSIKGKEAYDLCLKQSLGLRQLFTSNELESLKEALEDY